MKKTVLVILVSLICYCSSGQRSNQSAPPTSEDFLLKSKKQKTAAWLMLGGGTLLFTGGYTLMVYEALQGDGLHSAKGIIYRTAFYIGGLSMLGSIPLFISAAENKGRAYGLSGRLKVEKTTTINRGSFVQQSYPAVALNIQLGK